MNSSLRIRLDETLRKLVDRHPLLVDYFVKNSPGELILSRTVQEYLEHQSLTRSQFEEELRGHLQSALQPEVEECETLTCRPLPFCPEDVFDVSSGEVFPLFLSIIKNPLDWINRTVQVLVRFFEKRSLSLHAD